MAKTVRKSGATASRSRMVGNRIVVTVTSGAGGGYDIDYKPKIFGKGRGSSKVRLVLADPQKLGCQFSGFHWLQAAMPSGYCKSIQVGASSIELDLDNKYPARTDCGYRVFVTMATRRHLPATAVAAASRVSMHEDAASLALRAARMASVEVTGLIDVAIVAQLRPTGPIIRNEPR